MHGGKVYATSEGAGKGSTFTVELPVEAKLDAGAPVNDEEEVRSIAQRILNVEDNKDAADSARLL